MEGPLRFYKSHQKQTYRLVGVIFILLLLNSLFNPLYFAGVMAGLEDEADWSFGKNVEKEVDVVKSEYKDEKLHFYARDNGPYWSREEEGRARAWAEKTFYIEAGSRLKFTWKGYSKDFDEGSYTSLKVFVGETLIFERRISSEGTYEDTFIKDNVVESDGNYKIKFEVLWDFKVGRWNKEEFQWNVYDIEIIPPTKPKPRVVDVNYPNEIILGSYAYITVTVKNEGEEANWMTINIAFPQDPSDVSIVSHSLHEARVYKRDEERWGGYGTKKVKLKYCMVEGRRFPWDGGSQYYLEVKVKPERAGTFTFYVKSVAGRQPDGKCYSWDPKSGTKDQQDEYVYVYKIKVREAEISLRSRSTDGLTNLGEITFDGIRYDLPADIKKSAGSYTATAHDPTGALIGYEFYRWESSGDISVSSPNSRTTTVTVSGDGTLRAVFIPPIYLTSIADGQRDLGTITFCGTTYSLPKTVPTVSGVCCQATANPPPGYIFVRWETSGKVRVNDPNSRTTIVDINGAGTLKAVFGSPKARLTVKVHNIKGFNLPQGGGEIIVKLWRGHYDKYVGERSKHFSSGESYVSVEFKDLEMGEYVIEVYQRPNGGLRYTEFWGWMEFKVDETVETIDFYRFLMYICELDIPKQVSPGDDIKTTVKVCYPDYAKNLAPEEFDFRVKLIVDKDKKSPWKIELPSGKFSIKSGESRDIPLTFNIQEEGKYYVYKLVEWWDPWNKRYVIVDQGLWEDLEVKQKVIEFSGYRWIVKSGYGGPGPNYWSSENIWVDENGWLHLKITNKNGKWYCAEIYTEKILGYGTYVYYLASRIDKLDKNVVLGLFAYKDDEHEVDIEFSRWGDEHNKNAWFTVQPKPYTEGANQIGFDINLKDTYSTHWFMWSEDFILFESFHGHYPYQTPPKNNIILTWLSSSQRSAEGARAHINLWLHKGKEPSDKREIEVVIKEFKFYPATTPPRLPDLTITSVSAKPSELHPGEELTVRFKEENKGEAETPLFNTAIYLGKTEYGCDYLLGKSSCHILKPGESKLFEQKVTIPYDVPPGNYYITVFIDYSNEVKERNENNNIGSSTPEKVTIRVKTIIVLDPLPNMVEEFDEIIFKGRLLIEHNKMGVSNATIKVYDKDIEWDDFIAKGTTDSEGYFKIKWYAFYKDFPSSIPLLGDPEPDIYLKFEGTKFFESSKTSIYDIKINEIKLPPPKPPTPPSPQGALSLYPPFSYSSVGLMKPENPTTAAGAICDVKAGDYWSYFKLSSWSEGGESISIGMVSHYMKFKVQDTGIYNISFIYQINGGANFYNIPGITLKNVENVKELLKEFIQGIIEKWLEELLLENPPINVKLIYYLYSYSDQEILYKAWKDIYSSKAEFLDLWRYEDFVFNEHISFNLKLEKEKTYGLYMIVIANTITKIDAPLGASETRVLVRGLPIAVFIQPINTTSPIVKVQPKTWSAAIGAGESRSKVFTVSATLGTIKGVTLTKISGPDWITINATTLGDISTDFQKAFTVNISPPSGTSPGSYNYSIRVSCIEGEPKQIDISGTIEVVDNAPPKFTNIQVEPSESIYDDYDGNIRFKIYWMDNVRISDIKFEFWVDSTQLGGRDPTDKDVDASGNGWYWYEMPRSEWINYIGKGIRWHSVAWDEAGNIGDTKTETLDDYIVYLKDDDRNGPSITDVKVSEYDGDGDNRIEEGEKIRISWSLSDKSGIHSTSITIDGEKPPVQESYYVIVGPYTTGTYQFKITATDNDNDRDNDRATNTYTGSFTVNKQTYTVTLDSSPRISSIIVDGATYKPKELPKSFSWTKETEHNFSIPQTHIVKDHEIVEDGVLYQFTGWNDGNTSPQRKITVTGDAQYTALFERFHLLAVGTEPIHADLEVNPPPDKPIYVIQIIPPPDWPEPIGWYRTDRVVQLRAPEELVIGGKTYVFSHWTIFGIWAIFRENPITVPMNMPRLITAHYTERGAPTPIVIPSSGSKGGLVKVYGEGVTAGSAIELYWDLVQSWDGVAGLLNTTTARADGSYEVWFRVPEGVNGTHYLWVVDTSTGVATPTPFTVLPMVTASPGSGPPGAEVEIYGYGFSAEVNATIGICSPEMPMEMLAEIPKTTPLGSFTQRVTIPPLAPGNYTIIALDDEGVEAETPFEVTPPPGIILSPSEGETGTQVTLSGVGFTPGGTWNATIDGVPITGPKEPVAADGSITYTFYIPTLEPGNYTVTALDIATGLTAQAPFKVLKIVEHPPEFDKTFVGGTLTLPFGVTFSESEGSMALILINYTAGNWTYGGFSAFMDDIDVTDQFDERHDPNAGTLILNCSDIDPANGTLSLKVWFKANSKGTYIFSWRYIYVAFKLPPEMPTTIEGEGNTTVEVTEQIQFTIRLHKGWNLIGIPLELQTPSVEEALKEVLKHIEAIYGYENGKWVYWIRGIPPNYQTLKELKAARGYWIKVEADLNITLIGYPTDKPIELKKGWNLISPTIDEIPLPPPDWHPWPPPVIPLKKFLEKIIDWIEIEKIKYIYGFDNIVKKFNFWIRGIPEIYQTLKEMNPGRGYWIYID